MESEIQSSIERNVQIPSGNTSLEADLAVPPRARGFRCDERVAIVPGASYRFEQPGHARTGGETCDRMVPKSSVIRPLARWV